MIEENEENNKINEEYYDSIQIKTEKYNNGEYSGEFKEGKREGQGKYTWKTNSIYEGQFKNDNFDGKGVFTWANGEKYIGDFKNGVKEGKGIYE